MDEALQCVILFLIFCIFYSNW